MALSGRAWHGEAWQGKAGLGKGFTLVQSFALSGV